MLKGIALLCSVWLCICCRLYAQAPNISYQNPQVYTINTPIVPLLPKNTGGSVPPNAYGQVSTFAGDGKVGSTDGQGSTAQFNGPRAIAIDNQGNLYIADEGNNKIRMITPQGLVTTLAGSGATGAINATGINATFTNPNGVTIDLIGNLYVADSGNQLIREITPTGAVTTLAGSGATGNIDGKQYARFDFPNDLALDNMGNLYVTDYASHEIRRVSPDGTVHTVAGLATYGFQDGTGPAARFYNPGGITIDGSGNLIICDVGNDAIRAMTPDSVVTTIAGSGTKGFANGKGSAAMFNYPANLAIDQLGNMYVSDSFNYLIRKIDPSGNVTTLAGIQGTPGFADGSRYTAMFNRTFGIAADKIGNLYVSDDGNSAIRKISLTGYDIDKPLPAGLSFDQTTGTISGTPTAASPSANYTITAYNLYGSSSTILNITVNNTANQPATSPPQISYQTPQVYTVNTSITPLSPQNTGGAVPATIYAQVTTFVGSGAEGYSDGTGTNAVFDHPARLCQDAATGNLYVADRDNGVIRKVTPAGVVTTFATGFNQPNDVTIDPSDNLYVADAASNSIKLVTSAGVVSTFAGNGSQSFNNGPGLSAAFYYPYGIGRDATGNLYVADSQNNMVRTITPDAIVSTFAGTGAAGSTDGAGAQASFNDPNSVVFDAAGNMYIGDSKSNKVRKITPGAIVSTFAGTGATGNQNGTITTATFNGPGGIALDAAGNTYLADVHNYLLRKVDAQGNVTTLAGTGNPGSSDGIGTAASFNLAYGLNYNTSGFLYITDLGNNTIRKICLTGYTIDKTLPPGLTFDTTTGTISGTPTATSPATNYTITAYNTAGSSSAIVNIAVKYVLPVSNPPVISYQTPEIYTVSNQITPLAPQNTGGAVPATIYGQVTAFVGNGAQGNQDGTGASAYFNHPIRLGEDQATGNLYVADRDNNLIRKVTPTGVVTTFANGFNQPNDVTMGVDGNLYVADAASNSIKQVTPSGTVTTFAGSGSESFANGVGTAASFYYPYGIVTDAGGNFYVVDSQNSLIRKITPSALVTTFAGNGAAGYADGTGTAASFSTPNNIAIDAAGNLYVGDTFNNRIRKITPAGLVTTIAGTGASGNADGPAAVATFNEPGGTAADAAGNIYVADVGNYIIRKIDKLGNVTTLAGSGAPGSNNGVGTKASFERAYGVTADLTGILYVTDLGNNNIRKICLTGYTIDKPLPAGLTFDQTTGIISGTPTAISPATDYTVTAYNAAGSSSTIVSIRVISPLTLAAIPGKTICDADFAPEASGGTGTYTYASSNTAVATIVSGNIHITGPGTTTITANDGVSTQTQSLTVAQPVVPTISIDPSFYSSCDGTSLTYTATVTNAGVNPTYQWKVNGQPVANNNINSFTSSILQTGDIINCTLTNNSDCTVGPVVSNNASLSADPYVTPTISIQSSASGPVAPTTVITFTATITNGGTDPIYQWQVNNANVGTNSPTYSASCFNDGDVVTCDLTNQGGKCLTTLFASSSPITVGITAKPITVNITSSTNTIYSGALVSFTATVNNGTPQAYQWMINNTDVGTNSPTFTSSSLKNGDVITCTATASNGCTITVISNQITMTVYPSLNITIPTAFSPNNDGINDQWNIEALAGYPNCLVDIYTRYGTLIFHSKGYSKPWDGTLHGSQLSSGTYYYVIDLGNNLPKLSGYVAIIR